MLHIALYKRGESRGIQMLQTFKANLKGNQLEWLDDQPISRFDKPRPAYAVLLEESQVDQSEQAKDFQFNENTLAALKEIETCGGKVFENVEELFKDLDD